MDCIWYYFCWWCARLSFRNDFFARGWQVDIRGRRQPHGYDDALHYARVLCRAARAGRYCFHDRPGWSAAHADWSADVLPDHVRIVLLLPGYAAAD